ncbi:hypothetical protein [Kutzneria buriramensis]|nr:hypothetical protein [Kutzneria buriramensis]
MLTDAGVTVSVSQVAKHFDDVIAWRDHAITLADLCEKTGWHPPQQDTSDTEPTTASGDQDPLAAVRAAKAAMLAARRTFKNAVLAAKDRGVDPITLVAEVRDVMSEPAARRLLGLESLQDKARRLLYDIEIEDGTALVLVERGVTTLDFAGSEIMDSGYPLRYNTAAAMLGHLREHGITAAKDGWADPTEALAEGHSVELSEMPE